MQYNLLIALFLAFAFSSIGSAQDSPAAELNYKVDRIYTPLAITKEALKESKTLNDLNRFYKPSWVKEYITVEIMANNNGQLKKAISKNDTLSQDQKDLMYRSDEGSSITVKIQYIPDNTLKNNSVKMYDFSFIVDPEIEASFPEGQNEMRKYFKEKAMDLIPDNSFKKYDVSVIKFTVDEEGEIISVHLFQASNDDKVDALILETVQNMPCWTPAEYASGEKAKQEFVLRVGSMYNCVNGLLNIRQD